MIQRAPTEDIARVLVSDEWTNKKLSDCTLMQLQWSVAHGIALGMGLIDESTVRQTPIKRLDIDRDLLPDAIRYPFGNGDVDPGEGETSYASKIVQDAVMQDMLTGGVNVLGDKLRTGQ
ncbi:MAG: hypothetical protein EZS28_051879, partial [Streblomastix strix]